jgi:hypothetical protein
MGLGWDETVYVSQVSGHAPAAFFSAPRARGISVVVAPVAALTTSTVALRVYLALLSGAGLFAALWVWRRLRPASELALAGVLFAGLWITLFYGPQAMPNLWVALGALAAVGFFLRAVTDRSDRVAPIGLGLCVAFVVLLRPADGFWLGLPLAAAVLFVPAWRRPALLAVLAAGLAVGGAQWVIEAYVRYGGVAARLRTSSDVEGGMGWHLAFGYQLRSLGGDTLCRPCDVPWRHKAVSLWWFALPLLVAGGLVVAARARRLRGELLPVVCGLSLGVQYLFLIDYAAPRFLLPTYALLALPVAGFLRWVATAGGPRPRPLPALLVATGLAGHLAVQQVVLNHVVNTAVAAHDGYAQVAADLHRLGVRPPCLLTGANDVPIAYYAGCSSVDVAGNNANITKRELVEKSARQPVAVLVQQGSRPPAYARDWPSRTLPPTSGLPRYRVYHSR